MILTGQRPSQKSPTVLLTTALSPTITLNRLRAINDVDDDDDDDNDKDDLWTVSTGWLLVTCHRNLYCISLV